MELGDQAAIDVFIRRESTVLDEPVAETPIYPPLLDDGFVAWPRRAVLRD